MIFDLYFAYQRSNDVPQRFSGQSGSAAKIIMSICLHIGILYVNMADLCWNLEKSWGWMNWFF